MGKVIRRTVTITITESWTIVWLPDDSSVHYPVVGYEQPKPDEEVNEEVLLQMLFEKEFEQESEQQFKKENRDE